jgi:hypothetical protein
MSSANVLALIDRTLGLFDASAEELDDVALRAYAARGMKSASYSDPARTLDSVRVTAHIARTRLELMIQNRDLTPDLVERAIHYRDQLDLCIRAALYLLQPDRYSFCESSLAEALGTQEVTS